MSAREVPEGYDAAIDFGVPANVTNGKAGTVDNRPMAADYIGPTATWWHIAYADRPGRFAYDRAEAIRIAEETRAQFVQERGGARRIVWEAL